MGVGVGVGADVAVGGGAGVTVQTGVGVETRVTLVIATASVVGAPTRISNHGVLMAQPVSRPDRMMARPRERPGLTGEANLDRIQ